MRVLIIPLTCLILSACAGNKIVNTEVIQQQSAIEASNSKLSPEQAIQVAETKYAAAIKAELDIYAPLHLNQAQESIAQAHDSLLKSPKDTKGKALMAAITAQKIIIDAHTNKKKVQANLKEVLTHNAELLKLDAPTRLPIDYQTIKTQLLDLIELIEKGQIADAIRGQAPLLAEMSQLEIKTLKHTHLSEAESLIKKAEKNNGDKYAQVSFKTAIELFQNANTFITKEYRNRKGVKKIGLEALWAAKHAYFVTLESKKLMQLESSESEQYILNLIAYQNSLSQITSNNDLPPQALSSANSKLLTMVNDLKAHLKASQQALKNSQTTNTIPFLQDTTIGPADDEVVVVRTLPPMSKEEPTFSKEQVLVEEPSFQVDEQGFDDFEQMTDDE